MKARWLGVSAAAMMVFGAGQASADLALAKASGCLACHSVEKKIVGPAWKDVSARYKGDAGARDALIAKVKKGGKGNWTDVTGGVPMPPNSPRVSDENIAKLVDFVLGLAK
ncbi:MAG: c-type cytochrome [Gammaproteobacteria bacterium]